MTTFLQPSSDYGKQFYGLHSKVLYKSVELEFAINIGIAENVTTLTYAVRAGENTQYFKNFEDATLFFSGVQQGLAMATPE